MTETELKFVINTLDTLIDFLDNHIGHSYPMPFDKLQLMNSMSLLNKAKDLIQKVIDNPVAE